MECKVRAAECSVGENPKNALSGESSGRQVDVRAQHDNGVRPRFHPVSRVETAKLWGLT